MKDLFDRVRGDLDFTKLIRYLERIGDLMADDDPVLYAQQVRDLRDRLVRGMPVHASELDIESFLAVDLLKQIRDITLCPDEKPLILHIQKMAEAMNSGSTYREELEKKHDRTNNR